MVPPMRPKTPPLAKPTRPCPVPSASSGVPPGIYPVPKDKLCDRDRWSRVTRRLLAGFATGLHLLYHLVRLSYLGIDLL